MLRNCNECGKIFSHPVNRICSECARSRNDQFVLVRDYLKKHPNGLVSEVVTETGVSIERVKEFIKEGRLQIIPADYYHHCELCGTKITSGKLCSRCESKFRGSEKVKDIPKNKDSVAKMHLLDTKRKKRSD